MMPANAKCLFGGLLAVSVTLAGCGWGAETYHLAGTLERTILEIAAPVSEEIVELPVPRGGRVEKGDVVVRLDSEVAEAELHAHEAALAAARAAVTETEREFNRAAELQRRRVASVQDFDRAKRKHEEAVAQAAEREARIAQAKKHLDDLTIRSYAAGVVDQLPFEEGERVPAGGVVAVIQTDEKPWVRVWVPSRAVSGLTAEATAEVRVEGLRQRLTGRVEDVAREPEFTPHFALTERESAHLVYQGRIVLEDAPADLRPGLPAQVKLRVPKRRKEDS